MTAPPADPRPRPRDATEALRLPSVEIEHLDRVLHAARSGESLALALAVLIQAIGWIIAASWDRRVRAALLAGIPGAIVQAVLLHDRRLGGRG